MDGKTIDMNGFNYFEDKNKMNFAELEKYDIFQTPEQIQEAFSLNDDEIIEYWKYSRLKPEFYDDGQIASQLMMKYQYKADMDGEEIAGIWLKEELKKIRSIQKQREKTLKRLQKKLTA